ncbi:hypothetical protein [Novacetimonas pomaceti]|nr:hypothetical protein [Novacetimonas pomaceti]PYD47252.1 hypothetical protein C3920_11070 [Novacetimonas pomaceti]
MRAGNRAPRAAFVYGTTCAARRFPHAMRVVRFRVTHALSPRAARTTADKEYAAMTRPMPMTTPKVLMKGMAGAVPLLLLGLSSAPALAHGQAQDTTTPGMTDPALPDKATSDRTGATSSNTHAERPGNKPASDYNNAPYLQDQQALGRKAQKSRLSHGKSPTREEAIPPGMNAPNVQRDPAQPPD